MSVQIRRLCHALGAEIIGIDIRKPLSEKSIDEIRSAFLEHAVLLFRGQPMTREQHIAFTRQLGEIDSNEDTREKRDPEFPEVLVHDPEPHAKKYAGAVWHTDRAFALVPTSASLLRGIKLPEVGGDTMFANMYLAYDTLSDGMKKLIDGLHGVHSGGEMLLASLEKSKRPPPIAAQPLVRVHPETGRKSLFIGARVKVIAGMTAEESKPLLEFLCQHATRPQFFYRHQWQNNDLLMWDNRCTMHIALGDYDRALPRHMEKTALVGTPCGYAYDGPRQ